MSPTILDIEGYRFFFYSREFSGGGLEPRHIHIRKGGAEAKVWIDFVEMATVYGFSHAEERTILELVRKNQAVLQKAWDDYFREPPSQSI